MGTYTQLLYHIVFSPKHRARILYKHNRPALFKYMAGVLKNKNCHLYQINGVEDHLHILTHIHPSIAVAELVKDLKVASSIHIKKEWLFPYFEGWQEGYSAFTKTIREKERLIRYIQRQEEHHRKVTYRAELERLLRENGIEVDEQYFL